MQEFILVAEKLFIGFLALIFVINISGKGNLRPAQPPMRCKTMYWVVLSAA